MKKQIAALLALLMTVASFTACGNNPSDPDALARKKQDGSRAKLAEPGEIKSAQSYDEVLTLFKLLENRSYNDFGTTVTDETMAGENATGNDSTTYSGTNVQVAGVDEADVVKTDGEYLYILGHDTLQIVRADGANTETVSTTSLKLPKDVMDDSGESYSYVNAMYIGENTASIIWQQEQYSYANNVYSNSNTTHVSTFDISDKKAPRLIKDVGQDGYYLDSRMTDGVIYLVTTKSFYTVDELTTEDTLIPCTFSGTAAKKIPATSIYICPDTDSTSFTVVSAIDGKSGEISDSISYTDGTDTVYMDGEKLYLTSTCYITGESEPYKENQYTVVDYTQRTVTQINRIGFADGKLVLEKSSSVDGTLRNQFSMDVYNGNLRIATTTDENSYSIYTDETYGWSNTVTLSDETQNRVTILDSALGELGGLDDLAMDERIYGVRFIGNVGYVVTFETIDPIFTIDLSDPTRPTLCSELEVPGVSLYLHSYGDGLLFGFGENVTDGMANGLMLSMFDVKDPTKVKLLAQSPLDAYSSEALYDHKAILVNSDKNLIAFPIDAEQSQFLVYAYENGAFAQKGKFSLNYYSYDMRGLFIGDYLYICGSDVVYAAKLDTCEVVAELNSAEG